MATVNKIRRSLRGDKLTLSNVEKEINKLGYSVVSYNTPIGDLEIERYYLEEEKKTMDAFTYYETAKIVFVDGNLHSTDRLYLLLHELGHICLNHLEGDNISNNNKYLLDIEADNFAYSIIKGKQTWSENILLASIILSASIIAGVYITNTFPKTVETTAISPKTPIATETNIYKGDMVYITTYGTKFHKAGCRYIKGKDLPAIPRVQAEKNYTPCSVCDP